MLDGTSWWSLCFVAGDSHNVVDQVAVETMLTTDEATECAVSSTSDASDTQMKTPACLCKLARRDAADFALAVKSAYNYYGGN